MRTVFAAGLVLAAGIASATPGRAGQIPQQFTNLQVLPRDIARQDLIVTMREYALTLGVRCEHCHDGEGSDLSRFDFASDAKPAKAITRRMHSMVVTINEEYLGGAPADEPQVTCFTCHRGQTKPATAPEGGGSGQGA